MPCHAQTPAHPHHGKRAEGLTTAACLQVARRKAAAALVTEVLGEQEGTETTVCAVCTEAPRRGLALRHSSPRARATCAARRSAQPRDFLCTGLRLEAAMSGAVVGAGGGAAGLCARAVRAAGQPWQRAQRPGSGGRCGGGARRRRQAGQQHRTPASAPAVPAISGRAASLAWRALRSAGAGRRAATCRRTTRAAPGWHLLCCHLGTYIQTSW